MRVIMPAIIDQAGRKFNVDKAEGVSRRHRRDRWRETGVPGLVPHYPAQRPSRLAPETLALIEHARKVLEYGAARTHVWLRRVHQIRLPHHSCSGITARPRVMSRFFARGMVLNRYRLALRVVNYSSARPSAVMASRQRSSPIDLATPPA